MHQYLTTKNIINSKNARSHLAFDQTPSICTVHICKKIRNFRKLDGVLLLLHSFSSPLLLLSFCSSMRRGRRRPWSRGREQGALGRKSVARSGPWERGGSLRGGRRWQESGDEDGGLGAARGDGDGGLGTAGGDRDEERWARGGTRRRGRRGRWARGCRRRGRRGLGEATALAAAA